MEAISSVTEKPAPEEVRVQALVRRGRAFKAIATRRDFEKVGELLRDVKTEIQRRTEYFEPLRQKAKSAYDEVLEKKKEALEPLERIDGYLRGLGNAYLIEERRERERKEAELRADARRNEEEARKLDVAALKDAGQHEEAAAVEAAPIQVAPVVLDAPKAQGISAPRHWAYRIVNEGILPDEWWIPDHDRMKKYIRAVGEKAQIPGVEIYEEISMAVRSR